MIRTPPSPERAMEQLSLPLSPASPVAPYRAEEVLLAPSQLWASLTAAGREQLRRRLLRIVREAFDDAHSR